MKKRRKFFQRAAALLCCIFLLPSLVAVPVLAADDTEFFDVLEFSTANDSGSQVVTGSLPMSVIYRTVMEPFRYIDMLVTCDIPDLTVTYGGYQLNTILIGTNYGYTYRVFGDLVGDPSGYLAFTIGGSSGSWISFEKMEISSFTFSQSVYPSLGSLFADPAEYGTYEVMETPQHDVKITFDINNLYEWYDYWHSQIQILDWKKFDSVDVMIEIKCNTIDSISVVQDGVALPFTVSYLNSTFAPDSSMMDDSTQIKVDSYYVVVSIDLAGVNRSALMNPMIELTGMYSPYSTGEPQYIQLNGVTGYVVAEASSPLGTFWKNLVSTLNQLFGKNDPAAEAAKQEQADIDYEVNLQIVGAMENWDANIDVVTLGFDNFFLKTQPALIWLGTLADGVFNNMGWFKNVFFTLGLFSIFMFILSKSGVAHSVGKYIGRDKK